MLFYINWIERGFQVHQQPGVSRAWIRIEDDGRQLILTDESGFDLPSRNGPFLICLLDRDNELIDGPQWIATRLSLAKWLRQRSNIPIPTDPRM